MKVGFITQWYPPETGSAALPGTLTDALVAEGVDVRVVTGFPNYPDGTLPPGWRQRWNHRELRDSTPVFRTPIYVSHDDNPVRRMANYVSFAMSATLTSLRSLREVDVTWVHGTPALAAFPALALKWLAGVPYVLHVQDLWPDTVLASGMLPRRVETAARLALEWFCRLVYSEAAVIGIIAPGMRQTLVSRGVPDSKIVDIANWADEGVFVPTSSSRSTREDLGLPDGFVCMYAGAMGEVQGLETVIRAAQFLTEDEDVTLALVGDGTARHRLQALARELGCTNVVFVPSQPLNRMADVLAAADMQIICLKDLPLYRITLPSKVQATLAAGQPMIVSAGGDAATVASASGAGIAVSPGDPHELARAILMAANSSAVDLAQWGQAAREYYLENFSRARGVSQMIGALRDASYTRKGTP